MTLYQCDNEYVFEHEQADIKYYADISTIKYYADLSTTGYHFFSDKAVFLEFVAKLVHDDVYQFNVGTVTPV